jgi:DHA1 family bicyclomycin/chloramphenicol resistance-like MFS transporter
MALDIFPQHRGLASSMQGFVQTMLNAAVAGLISPMLSFSPILLAIGMMGFLLLGGLTWSLLSRAQHKTV